MNLLDQVKVLRHNLPIIQRSGIVLPLNPNFTSTMDAYRFASLIHPARDILTKIEHADPGGHELPIRLRGWNMRVKSGYTNKDIDVDFRRILNSIMHMSYLLVDDKTLDVENDNNTDRLYRRFGGSA
ncbi:MAG: hypothetical protein OXC31_13260 [Spirochaetaceae bacterium]|nr:hypothetical protein [Spirochaetaceae bacterium]